jgi:hypothetical protein
MIEYRTTYEPFNEGIALPPTTDGNWTLLTASIEERLENGINSYTRNTYFIWTREISDE